MAASKGGSLWSMFSFGQYWCIWDDGARMMLQLSWMATSLKSPLRVRIGARVPAERTSSQRRHGLAAK